MYKIMIYSLILHLTRSHARVAISDETIKDISNNLIDDVIKVNLSTINIIESETSVNNLVDTSDNSEATTLVPETETKINVETEENDHKDISENVIDSDSDEKVDEHVSESVGEALILTPLIKNNQFEEARNACKVDPELFLGVESYSGFFTVNETYNSNLFFWYFPVEKKPVNETPWIIWLQGGPGASSMTGLFDEIGPFWVFPTGELRHNVFSWHQNHSLLFIDNPVGTGYSFTINEDGYTTDMETYSAHLWSALRQFLEVFPELRVSPLFIAGESYAGKYVPALAMHLHRNKGQANLKGLITGNAYVDPAMISEMERPFYYFGLMEPKQIDLIKPLTEALRQDIKQNRSAEAKEKWNHLITIMLLITHQKHAYNFLRDELSVGRYMHFLSKPKVKRALHVGNITFSFVNMTVNVKLNGDFLSSAKWMYEELLNHYDVLTYCGQLDQMLSCVLTSENYRTWKWNGSQEFIDSVRYPYLYNNRLAGYHKSGGHLTEVVIRGAGHMAAMDAPAPVAALVASWTHGRALSHLSLLDGTFVTDYVRNNSLFNVMHYL